MVDTRSSSYGAVRFSFSDQDVQKAETEGFERCRRAKSKKRVGRSGGPSGGEDMRMDILGSAGELAVAIFLGKTIGLFDDKVAVRGSPDIKPDIDVKTGARHHYRLMVHLDDLPSKKFVLVTIEGIDAGKYDAIIHGWIGGSDAMVGKYKSEPVPGRAAFFVPQKDLRPVAELLDCSMIDW